MGRRRGGEGEEEQCHQEVEGGNIEGKIRNGEGEEEEKKVVIIGAEKSRRKKGGQPLCLQEAESLWPWREQRRHQFY